MRVLLSLFAAGALLAAGPAAAGEKEPVKTSVLKVGAVAYSPDSVNVFRGMRHYFAKNNKPIEFVLYSTYDLLNDALEKGQVDVAWNSPLGHAKFHLKAGDSQALVMRDVDVDYRVKLVVRKDADVATLADLAGKAMVFGSCDSADATVLPVHFLKKDGVDFGKVKIVSLHNEVDEVGCPCHSQNHVLAALLKGRGQAGILSAGLWKKLQADKPDQAAHFKEVWTSPPFSHCVFTARKDLAADWKGQKAVVLIFLGTDCPVSNFYAPEHARLAKVFAEKGVVFYGIHADPDVTAAAAARHAADYRLPFPVLLDPAQAVTRQTGVRVVPSAVVLSPDGQVLYRGRVDDRYNAAGVRREVPTTHELEDALKAVLAGKAPPVAETKAFGCPLPEPAKSR